MIDFPLPPFDDHAFECPIGLSVGNVFGLHVEFWSHQKVHPRNEVTGSFTRLALEERNRDWDHYIAIVGPHE